MPGARGPPVRFLWKKSPDLPDSAESLMREKLGLDRVDPGDVFIVSYPRSGNTWVRFMLASLLAPETVIGFHNIENYVPDLYRSRLRANRMTGRRFLKTHHPLFDVFPRVIYVYRDGRDALASLFYYRRTAESFTDFLRARLDQKQNPGAWQGHVRSALDFVRRCPSRILLVRYEDLLFDPVSGLGRIADFCGLTAVRAALDRAAGVCSFERLRDGESKFGSEAGIRQGPPFFRSGRAGEWRLTFSSNDLEMFNAAAGQEMKSLGYETGYDAQLRFACSDNIETALGAG